MPIKTEKKSAKEVFTKEITDTTNLEGTQRSQEDNYLPFQDSLYFQDKLMKIPARTRLASNLKFSENEWNYRLDIQKGKPWNVAMKNLQLPDEVWQPSDVEIVQRMIGIQESFYVPFVNTYPMWGLQMNLQDIGLFFGITEDLSPEIQYNLDYRARVTIVIYSIQATAIATLFDGVQSPGSYTITWNVRDDNGKKMPSGDYIAEVRVGEERISIKRIKIP